MNDIGQVTLISFIILPNTFTGLIWMSLMFEQLFEKESKMLIVFAGLMLEYHNQISFHSSPRCLILRAKGYCQGDFTLLLSHLTHATVCLGFVSLFVFRTVLVIQIWQCFM